jgi:hypothetical protein
MDMVEPIGSWTTFHFKIYIKSNLEDKNIEKYGLFGKTIFLLWKNMHLYIAILQIAALT